MYKNTIKHFFYWTRRQVNLFLSNVYHIKTTHLINVQIYIVSKNLKSFNFYFPWNEYLLL